MSRTPFDDEDDINPFAPGYNDYNPFSNATAHVSAPDTKPTPELKFKEEPTPPASTNPFGTPSSSSYGTAAAPSSDSKDQKLETVLLESNDDDSENFYKDSTTDSSVVSLLSEPQTFTTSTQSGARITVSQKAAKNPEEKKFKFYQVEYYQQFFNVNTSDVVVRCLRSMWPFKNDFLDTIKQNPDFFGPFWVSTTLIFMMAAAGNFSAYLSNSSTWHYDITKLTYGAAVIYSYIFLIPTCLWFYLRWIEIRIRLIAALCIYGYSLFIYLPVSILCIIPTGWVKWVFVGVGLFLSTGFLVVNLWMPLKEKLGCAFIILIIIASLHVGLALTFRLYFFCYTANGSLNLLC